MHMLCKTEIVFLWVSDQHFIFYRIGVCTTQTHMFRLLPSDLAISLKQILSIFPIPLLSPLLSENDMQINSTSGKTNNPTKQWVLVIDIIVIRVKNCPFPPLCIPYNEHIVCVIYNRFSQIILEISLDLRRPSYVFVCQPDIDHIH